MGRCIGTVGMMMMVVAVVVVVAIVGGVGDGRPSGSRSIDGGGRFGCQWDEGGGNSAGTNCCTGCPPPACRRSRRALSILQCRLSAARTVRRGGGWVSGLAAALPPRCLAAHTSAALQG
jgi:hypothetical protein